MIGISDKIEIFNIIPNDLSEKERVLELASKDLVTFGQLFLSEDFMKSTPAPFHYELGGLLLDESNKRICAIIPRGHAKSTYVKASLLYKLFFNPKEKREFIAFVSEEQSQAVDHLKYIKSHIEFNPAFNYYFGDIVGKKWTEKEITTSKGDRIISKGTTQRLRGRSELGLRYTKIVLDDFESELNTKTPERRMEIKEWVMSTVMPALEESKGNEGSVWLIGTIVHYDSFLQSIYDGYSNAIDADEDYTWDVIFRRAIEDGKALWPDYFNKEKLKEIKRGYIEQGLTHKFAQEYMNDARDLDSAKFKIDRINYYDGRFESKNNQAYVVTKEDAIPINVYMGVDLAYESSAQHDYQVIMVVGIDSDKNFYILEYFREHFPLYDMPKKIFEWAKMYQPLRRANVEHVGAQGVIRDAVNALEGKDRKMAPGIAMGVRPPTGIKKEDRVEATLCPIVNRKKLYIKKQHQELVDEMFHFPKGKNDDLLDGLWYSVINARSPISNKFDASDFESNVEERAQKKTVKRLRSWMTGQRI